MYSRYRQTAKSDWLPDSRKIAFRLPMENVIGEPSLFWSSDTVLSNRVDAERDPTINGTCSTDELFGGLARDCVGPSNYTAMSSRPMIWPCRSG